MVTEAAITHVHCAETNMTANLSKVAGVVQACIAMDAILSS